MSTHRRLGEILVELGVVVPGELARALDHARQWEQPLGRSLVALGLCDEQTVVGARALKFALPSMQLAEVTPDRELLALVGAELAETHQVVPLRALDTRPRTILQLAMSNPEDTEAITAIEFATGMRVVPVLAGDADLAAAVTRLYHENFDHLPVVQGYLTLELTEEPESFDDEPTLDPQTIARRRVFASRPDFPSE